MSEDWGFKPIPKDRITWDTRFAGNVIYNDTVYIELKKNYNGSGTQSFGGADSWPVVELHFPFPTGAEALAELLRRELAELVAGFIEEHGLDLEA